MHLLPSLFGPIRKLLQSLSLAPQQTEECARTFRRRFLPEECLHAPADIRASPGPQPVALRGNPIKSECAEHVSQMMIPRERGETNGSSLLPGYFCGELLEELRDNFLCGRFDHALANGCNHPANLRLAFVA